MSVGSFFKASALVLFIGCFVGGAAERAEAMLQRRDGRIALNTAMTETGATAKAVRSMYMQPNWMRGTAGCPALRAKLQRASLLNRDPFSRRFQMSLGNIEGIGQPTLCLLLEHGSMAALKLADALGVDAGLLGHGLLTHPEC